MGRGACLAVSSRPLGQRQRRLDGRTCSCCSGERQLDGGWRIVVDCERQRSRPGCSSHRGTGELDMNCSHTTFLSWQTVCPLPYAEKMHFSWFSAWRSKFNNKHKVFTDAVKDCRNLALRTISCNSIGRKLKLRWHSTTTPGASAENFHEETCAGEFQGMFVARQHRTGFRRV